MWKRHDSFANACVAGKKRCLSRSAKTNGFRSVQGDRQGQFGSFCQELQ
jgi:hypothetical protein